MGTLYAQTPTHYPTGSNPVTFTAGEIIVYIVFPVLLFAFVIFYRRHTSSKKDGDQ